MIKKQILNNYRTELYKELNKLDEIQHLLTKIEDKKKEIELFKMWKKREGKYFIVYGFTSSKPYEYIFVKHISKNKHHHIYGCVDNKFIGEIITGFTIDDFCMDWTEITKEDFETKIKDYKDLRKEKGQ